MAKTESWYKIRDKNTGLFSTGGIDYKFNKTGKLWRKLAHVKAHFSLVADYGKFYQNCEIVEYNLEEYGTTDIT